MYTFKLGDKVRVKKNCSGTIAGRIYTLKLNYAKRLVCGFGSGGGCSCQSNWELVESEPKLSYPFALWCEEYYKKG